MIYHGEDAVYQSFSYINQHAKDSVATAAAGHKLAIVEGYLHNRSGSDTHLVLGTKLQDSDWVVYDYGQSTANVIGENLTHKAQTGSTFAFQKDTAGVGIVIGAKDKFGLIRVTVDSANAADPGYIFSYYDGVTQVAFTPSIKCPSTFVVGDTHIVFAPPSDWAKGCTAAVDTGYALTNLFCLRLVSSQQTDTSATFKDVQVGRVMFGLEQVADNDYMSINPREDIRLREGEGVVPYFGASGTDNMGVVAYKDITVK